MQSKCTHGTVAGTTKCDGSPKRELTEEQVMAHPARSRTTYANMTPEQRQQRQKRQRMNNKAPKRKRQLK